MALFSFFRTRATQAAGALIGMLFGALLAGCPPTGGNFGECETDQHCAGGEQCTRTKECVAGTLVEARIRWTIAGNAVAPGNAAACIDAGIDHLSVGFADGQLSDISYQPIPCNLGQILFDRMPPRLRSVSLTAFDARGNAIARDSVGIAPGLNEVNLDLRP